MLTIFNSPNVLSESYETLNFHRVTYSSVLHFSVPVKVLQFGNNIYGF